MIYFSSLIILVIIFFIINFLFKNLKSKFNKEHQKFAGKVSIPLIGGVIIFSYLIVYIKLFEELFLLYCFFLLLLGILSDIDKLHSPKIRLIIQILIISSFIYFSNLQILDLRNFYLNNFLSYEYFNIFFTTSCLLVLINGSNFIDGLDGLNLGYYLVGLFPILYLIQSPDISIANDQLILIFILISFLLVLNFLNIIYIGDSGSYLLGFIIGYLFIIFNNQNYLISPYFIALILWYPAFENLFSIIRKKISNSDPLNPDNLHLHQKLYHLFLNSNFKLLSENANPAASALINLYNLLIFCIGTLFFNETKILLILILFNVLVYLNCYFLFKKKD